MSISTSAVENAAQQGLELESNPEFGALMERAKGAAKALGPKATKSICGNKTLATAGKYCLDNLIRVAERAAGRPVEYDKSRRGWFPVNKPSHLARSRPSSSARRPSRRGRSRR